MILFFLFPQAEIVLSLFKFTFLYAKIWFRTQKLRGSKSYMRRRIINNPFADQMYDLITKELKNQEFLASVR